MLNTLSPAAVNKGDEGCRKEVGACGENIPGSSIASLTGFGEEVRRMWRRYKPGGEEEERAWRKRVEYDDNEVGGRGLESTGSGEN